MARFFFHLRTERGLESDTDGVEFPSLDRACEEALRAMPDLAADFLRAGRNPMDFTFQITGADGALLCELSFQALLPPNGGPA